LDQELSSPEKFALVEGLINHYVQRHEYEILAATDLNLHQGTGSEVLSSILKFSNKDYDFSKILGPANT